MKFIDLVMKQDLSKTEFMYAEHVCKQPWKDFSNTIGAMNKSDTLKLMKYILTRRPGSATLGKRAVQRFNSLNRVKWEDLTNGTVRKSSKEDS